MAINNISSLIIQWGSCIAPTQIILPTTYNIDYIISALARTNYSTARNYISETQEDTMHTLASFSLGTSTGNETSIFWFTIGP